VSKGRRFWPAASATGDLAQSEPRQFGAASGLIVGESPDAHGPVCPGEPWWHVPAAYVMLGTAFAIACTPFCILVWARWDGGGP
jgi:hypothetical protein